MKLKQTHVMYGFITVLAMIIVNVALYVSGLAFQPWAQYVSYIPFLIGLILNANAFSKANDHYVTFGNVFGSGFKATALIILCLLVWSFLSMYLIFPDMKAKAMEMAQEGMVKRGLSDEQIEKGMEMMKKSFNLFMVAGVVFGTLIVGAIFSLIAAAIAKKKGNPNPTVIQ